MNYPNSNLNSGDFKKTPQPNSGYVDKNNPNYPNQNKFDPSKTKADRGYYGNDNAKNYYPNSNSGNSVTSKPVETNRFPNSNITH